MIELPVQPLYDDAPHLASAYDSDAAFDLEAFVREECDSFTEQTVSSTITLAPGERALVKCGFALALPEGYVGLVCPRSGLALEHGVTVLNAPGVIDAGYQGEVGVILANLSDTEYTVQDGARIAQLLIVKLAAALPTEVQHLPESERGPSRFSRTTSFPARTGPTWTQG